MTDFFTRLRVFYAGLEPARQTQLWLGLFALVAIFAGGWWWMNNVPYAAVATGTQAELGEAASALRDEGIPMRVEGVQLLVPQDQLGNAMGVIKQAGMSHSIVDANQVPMGASPTVIEWALRRQKESDLGQAIAGMPGVMGARVHIEPGEQRLFSSDTSGASAAVFLDLAASASFGNEQVAAVQAMVANAVDRLTPDQVAVTDSRGRVLASGKGGSDPASRLADQFASMRLAYQQQIEASVERALRPYVGFENSMTVAATVDIDTSSRTIQDRDLNPDKVVEISTMIDESEKDKTAAPDGGAPGVDAALPERQADAPAGGAANKETRAKSQASMDVQRITTQTVEPAGRLTRASVSVSLDETRLAALWAVEPGSDAWKNKVAQLQDAARTAMGFSEERGDLLTLSVMPFAPIETVEAPFITVDGVLARTSPFVPYAIAGTAMLLAFLFVVRPLMDKVTSAPLRSNAQELGPDGQPRRLGGAEGELDLAERLHRLVENFQPVDGDDLNKLVDQQADASVQVLRSWAREG